MRRQVKTRNAVSNIERQPPKRQTHTIFIKQTRIKTTRLSSEKGSGGQCENTRAQRSRQTGTFLHLEPPQCPGALLCQQMKVGIKNTVQRRAKVKIACNLKRGLKPTRMKRRVKTRSAVTNMERQPPERQPHTIFIKQTRIKTTRRRLHKLTISAEPNMKLHASGATKSLGQVSGTQMLRMQLTAIKQTNGHIRIGTKTMGNTRIATRFRQGGTASMPTPKQQP